MKSTHAFSTARFAGLIIACSLLLALTVTSGCLAVAAGAGAGAAVAYVRGDLDTTLDASFAKSVHAVQKTVADLKYAKVSDQEDALQATIIARTSTDKKIEMYLEKVTDGTTKLKIRVGTFGEEALQNEILARVKENL
jgi:hypothetical protein